MRSAVRTPNVRRRNVLPDFRPQAARSFGQPCARPIAGYHTFPGSASSPLPTRSEAEWRGGGGGGGGALSGGAPPPRPRRPAPPPPPPPPGAGGGGNGRTFLG